MHGLERVMVVDWDVHHGSGTTRNCPLPAGSDGATVLRTLEEALRPAATRFRPQLLLLSAGFDGHRQDPLGRFQLSSADYGALTACCLAVAAEHCGGRLLSVLEGGYHLGALGESSAAHLEALLEAQAG